MTIYALGERVPTIAPSAYIHPDAVIIGDVHIGDNSSVWPKAVLRGDYGKISVGNYSNIQDGAVIHCTASGDSKIGSYVVVGHNVHMEEVTIDDDCLIGSGAVVLNKSIIKKGSVIAAGAVVSPGTWVPEHSMMLGIPARIRVNYQVPDGFSRSTANFYAENAKYYAQALRRID